MSETQWARFRLIEADIREAAAIGVPQTYYAALAEWLATQGLDDERLLWYLDYSCRDDFGAGLSRVDTFVTKDGKVMVNEINTMPGFTSISMYPKAWEATGVRYTDLITMLIEGVLR